MIDATAIDIEAYLEQHQQKELLRFVICGSVDDGKSTLIGRLLHDTHGIYEDQLSAVKRATKQANTEIDFSLFTDGLKAEREQGITIDVAYRYFSTERRKFIVADTPGHVQYTRNMATGASTANVAIVLIDARLGVLQQSRRHAYIASLLGIPRVCVAINKLDLKDYSEEVFEAIRHDFAAVAEKLDFAEVAFVPMSALRGDNVAERSSAMPWYSGPTLLEYLETTPIADHDAPGGFRFPVQTVIRPNLDYRAFAGQIASGAVRPGDRIQVLPSKVESTVKSIDTFEGEVDVARAPMSVSLRLADEVDASRGDMIVRAGEPPRILRRFDAMIVWMNERPLDLEKNYFLKHTSRYVRADVASVACCVDLSDLSEKPTETLELNDIGRVSVQCHQSLYFDGYRDNRQTGAFILIDSITNDTVAAGMIIDRGASQRDQPDDGSARSLVSSGERRELLGQRGGVIWVEGATEAATRVAYRIERRLFDQSRFAVVAVEWSPPLARLASEGVFVITTGTEPPPSVASVRVASTDVADVQISGDASEVEEDAKRVVDHLRTNEAFL